jgi:hypothetical protein
MARFDDWVTDPSVTRVGVEEFVADPRHLGRDFLGRYMVFTTGSMGVPALILQDRRTVAVMTGLTSLPPADWLSQSTSEADRCHWRHDRTESW